LFARGKDLCTFLRNWGLGLSRIDGGRLHMRCFGSRRRLGIVGDLGDHFAVIVEADAAGVADGGVEGAENEFSAAQFDGAANQGVDDFHDGGLDSFLVLQHGDGVKARPGNGDGAKHALVEIAELLSAKSGGAATDSGDFDVGAGLHVWHRGPIDLDFGLGLCQSNYFFVVAG
jgi:hypothetical protein